MPKKTPRVGPGRFQWNAGAWFGAGIGASMWLAGAAAVLMRENVTASVVAMACFLVPNVAGIALFLRRDRVAPYPALQLLVLLIGLASMAFIVYLNRVGLAAAVDRRLGFGERGFILVPVLFAGLLAWFHAMERSARKKRGEGAG